MYGGKSNGPSILILILYLRSIDEHPPFSIVCAFYAVFEKDVIWWTVNFGCYNSSVKSQSKTNVIITHRANNDLLFALNRHSDVHKLFFHLNFN